MNNESQFESSTDVASTAKVELQPENKVSRRRRAAHFLSWPELASSPPNLAIIEILTGLGFDVELYAPGQSNEFEDERGLRIHPVEYSRSWIIRNAWQPRWRRYSLFSGTTEDPMAIAGSLAFLHRRPSFTLADEIKTGSFSGNRSPAWKQFCRWAMRRSGFNIVNSEEKVQLQRIYLGVDEKYPMPVYPGCFHSLPVPGDRDLIRARLNIPKSALVLCFSGQFGQPWGADWMIDALLRTSDVHVLGQLLGLDPIVRRLLESLSSGNRLHLEPNRLSWQNTWAAMAAVDVGMVVYHHPAPQFQNNGIASNRLCMFLAMGVPVIASRQPSFEFIEKFDCGVLVSSSDEFIGAIEVVRGRLPEMRRNALRCAAEYIDAKGRLLELADAIEALVKDYI